MPAIGSKYGAKRTTVDGITFASKKEARRYGELKLLAKAGRVQDLRLQPRYPLHVNGELVCTYVADFAYVAVNDNGEAERPYVEDVKGFKTPEYRLKSKLFKAVHGFAIHEV